MGAVFFTRHRRALSALTSTAMMALRLSALGLGALALTGTGVMLAASAVLASAATLYGMAHTKQLILLCCRVVASGLWAAAGCTFAVAGAPVWVTVTCFLFAAVDVASPLIQDRCHDRP